MLRARRSPALVAAAVLMVYGGWAAWAHHLGHSWRSFGDPGTFFLDKASSSATIEADRGAAQSTYGYDGQFFLYIAQDPRGAVPYVDDAGYRYGRIVYPLLSRALALGRQGAIPLALVVVNLLAVAGGTWALAAWLRRRDCSPWLSLLFAAFPGIFICVRRDLSEVLAYSLSGLAVLVFDSQRVRRLAASSALFALAALTREGALVFALVWAAALLVERRRLRAVLFAAGAFLPYVIYRLVFLRIWLGQVGIPKSLRPTLIPFAGIAHYFPWGGDELEVVYSVLLPGTFCVGLAAYALYRGAREPAVWALLANGIVFVVLLPSASYIQYKAAGRISASVVLALVLAIPALSRVLPVTRTWMWAPVVAWFAPWFVLLPAALDSSWD
jgi:hypothetical protein